MMMMFSSWCLKVSDLREGVFTYGGVLVGGAGGPPRELTVKVMYFTS